MEGVVEGYNLVFVLVRRDRLADFSGELEGCFVGFRSAVAYKRAGGAGHTTRRVGKLDKLLGEQSGVRVVIEVRYVDELLGLQDSKLTPLIEPEAHSLGQGAVTNLFREHRNHTFVAVSQRIDRNSSCKI